MNIIFSKFLNLKPEKQERIINAAIKEFAQKGFVNASTNEIVKAANISKGLLFHYFDNKKDFYLFLYYYCLEIFMKEFFGKMDLGEKDILIRLRQMALLKIEIIKKHPEMFNFISDANIKDSGEVKNELESKNKEIITTGYAKIFEDIDVSKFRDGFDIKRAVNIIIWTFEGLRNQEQEKVKSRSLDQTYYDGLLAEMDIYIELFRNCFYQ
ncbi:MAG: TetR/AcrR family transcriptional regulator [Eubacteriales bacterium]